LYRNYPPVPLAELVNCADERVSLRRGLVLRSLGDVAGSHLAGGHTAGAPA
jgi:hypothetical protein